MVVGKPFEIDKEVYDRAQENGGYIAQEDTEKLFSVSIRCGYGLYGAKAYQDKDTGKYMCSWMRGSSCD